MPKDSNSQTKFLQLDEREQEREENRTPALVVVQGNEIGRRYKLEPGRWILGRDADRCDLVINDASVSGKHAMVQVDPEAGRYGLLDLGSRNGTLLNGSKVEACALRDGDKVFLGETVLKFTFLDAIEADYLSRIDQLMHIDSLTGLYVRRFFDHEYPKDFERARSLNRKLALLMMDMDGLKSVNDQHGHQLGSFCISETGKIILRKIKPNGIGCRFGGDEFVVYVRECSIDEAMRMAESIRGTIESFDFTHDGVTVAPTISIGVAVLTPEITSADLLARIADEALYRAKEAGRNTVARAD